MEPEVNEFQATQNTTHQKILLKLTKLGVELQALKDYNIAYADGLIAQITQLRQQVEPLVSESSEYQMSLGQTSNPQNLSQLPSKTSITQKCSCDFQADNSSVLWPSEPVICPGCLPFFLKSPVLMTIYDKISKEPDTKADWYLETLDTSTMELQDPVYSSLTDLLDEVVQRNPEILLTQFLQGHTMKIRQLIDVSVNKNKLNYQQGLVSSQFSSGTKKQYKFQSASETISKVWEEFSKGIDGAPSIRQLEKTLGTRWRQGPNSALSRKFLRRKILYQFIIYGIKHKNMDPKDIIAKLDAIATTKTQQKATITWFNKRYKAIMKKFYGVESLRSVNILSEH